MKLSIIIPVYNAELYLKKLLNSILASKDSFEVICIDDGSTDLSLNILQSVDDRRMKVYSKKNEGVYKTWKYGLDQATGEYVTVFDSDDYIETEYISCIMDFIDNVHADVLYTSYMLEDENGKRQGVNELPFHDGLYEGDKLEEIRDKLISGSVSYSKHTKIVKRNILMEQVKNSTDQPISDFEDWLTMISVFCKISSLYVLNKAYYHYVQHENSISKSKVSYRKNFQSLETVLHFFETNQYLNIDLNSICSIGFYGKRSLLYRCMKISEYDLAKKIVKDEQFQHFLRRAELNALEKGLLCSKNVCLIKMSYVLKKIVFKLVH